MGDVELTRASFLNPEQLRAFYYRRGGIIVHDEKQSWWDGKTSGPEPSYMTHENKWQTESRKVGAPYGTKQNMRMELDVPFLQSGIARAGATSVQPKTKYVETEKPIGQKNTEIDGLKLRYPLGVPPRKPQPVPDHYDTGRNYDRALGTGWLQPWFHEIEESYVRGSRVIRYPHKVVGDRWRNASMHTMAGGGWLPNIAQKASSAPNLAASDDRHREGNERIFGGHSTKMSPFDGSSTLPPLTATTSLAGSAKFSKSASQFAVSWPGR